MAMPLPAAGKRGQKVPVDAALEQTEQDIEKLNGKAKALPVKRGRKAELSVEDEERHVDSTDGDQEAEGSLKVIVTPVAAPVKRGRPRKVVQETLDQEESNPVLPIAKADTRKKTTTPSGSGSKSSRIRGTRKAGAGAASAAVQGGDDENEDEDPLESYNVEDDNKDADLPGPPPPSGTNKPKKGRKKATATTVVKQEPDDEQGFSDLEEEAPFATVKGTGTRASGSKRGGRATPTTRTPAPKDGGRKTRIKTPATAPASTTFIGSDKDKDKEKDKENDAVSGDGEDLEQVQTQAQGVTMKVRISRSRGAAGIRSGTATRSASKAVKVEVVEEEAAIVEPVRVRRTRAKTRTG